MNTIKFDYLKGEDVNYFSQLISNYIKENEIEITNFNLGISLNKNISDEDKINIKQRFQEPLIIELENQLNIKIQKELADIEIIVDFTKDKITLQLRPVYIYGTYLKFSRELPQTIHYCFKCRGRGCSNCNNTGKLSPTSIQEIISPYFIKEFKSSEDKFHGCGREDKDVRMLGTGRPFVIELIESKIRTKTKEEFREIENKINNNNKNLIEINNLRLSDKKEVIDVKNKEHKKKYLAKVECKKDYNLEKLEELLNKEIEIKQQTPSRVLKRRSDLTRIRYCTITKLEKINSKIFSIEIIADGGLYIKELISSDNNRTKPSITNIINNESTCLELDVLEII